jgi:hypothetical protein
MMFGGWERKEQEQGNNNHLNTDERTAQNGVVE